VTSLASILVVDDHSAIVNLLVTALRGKGYDAHGVNSGREALQVIAETPPDLILCDFTMPGMTGVEICRQVKGDEKTRHIPFLMVTGETDDEHRLEGIEAGADDYLTKPVQLAILFARTDVLLRSKRLDDEVRRQRAVIDHLLSVSAFNPNYGGSREKLFAEFTQRTAELLRAEQVALVVRQEHTFDLLSCYPEEQREDVRWRISRAERAVALVLDGDTVLVKPDDLARQSELRLVAGLAAVPIYSLEGPVMGGVVAFGIPVDPRPESMQILMTLAQRTGSELMMNRLKERLEEQVAERTQELREALAQLEEANIALEHAQEETVFRLALAAETRDNETANHLRRMGRHSELLARAIGLDPELIADLRYASLMHDVGKIGIPDVILQKPGKLTPEEYEIMKTHTILGADILRGSESSMLQMSERVALGHHEHWDGTGYPRGIAGEDIPLEARIVAVADVFDALTSRRRYKRAWSIDEAFDHLRELAGAHLDASLVEAFVGIRGHVTGVVEILGDSEE
jgi:response regulator RpfG family c-di-GMP phosphodiesterase